MKHNLAEVAELRPDYLGFIFYDKSPRNYTREDIVTNKDIKRVGVFVDASEEFVLQKIHKYDLDVIQLHGNESSEYCVSLKKSIPQHSTIEIWKVFSIKDSFDFTLLEPYEDIVDTFLFDTKGKEKGGNGYTFDWSVLKDYPSKKPFVLSGGIGLEEIDKVRALLQTDLPICAIDVNSRFETKPGLKDISALKKLNYELQR